MNRSFNLAREQINEIADASDGTVVVVDDTRLNGYLRLDINIRFDGRNRVVGGLRVRAREPFIIKVPPTFPFRRPFVETPHVRFSGFRHVQWQRRICLYASSSDWRPEDGMYGFIRRLDSWMRAAALDNLDPNDAPLHPPVEYSIVNRLIVPRVNTPIIDNAAWIGFAELRDRNRRSEIIGWKRLDQEPPEYFATAILLQEELSFEYPRTVEDLLKELESRGVNFYSILFQIASNIQQRGAWIPHTVILGTPMRRVAQEGPTLQHLAAWEIPTNDTYKLHDLFSSSHIDNPSRRESTIKDVVTWIVSAKVGWCRVREMRPEVTRRRDDTSPMAWFLGKNIAIWGCGAVGTHVAESIVRAGINRVELVDNGIVAPGLLVRQGYEDRDIGRLKAYALADRLKRINPDLKAEISTDDLVSKIVGPNPVPNVDLVIDCTASSGVRTALEYALRKIGSRPPIASLSIDSQAAAAIATLSRSDHSGGTLELVRRLKLESCRNSALSKFLETIWPRSESYKPFQPEPGCSEPTFIGSDADLRGLSGRMLNCIARAVVSTDEGDTGTGWLFEESGPVHTFSWRRDYSFADAGCGYSVRVCHHAMREMRGWARRSVRTAGTKVETGGLVFGEINEAAGVIWVADVDGPPPDSHAGEDHFTCGTKEVDDSVEKRKYRFRDSINYIGSWHTHPISPPNPSRTDLRTAVQILTKPGCSQKIHLMLILAGDPDAPSLGAHVFNRSGPGMKSIPIQLNTNSTRYIGPQTKNSKDIGLALSGGGSRAIAFHLGCLRALHDIGLLDRIQVISSVSGGSIIAAMYAYSNDSFPEFDKRVTKLLQRGLSCDIFWQSLAPKAVVMCIFAYAASIFFFALRVLICIVRFSLRKCMFAHRALTPMRIYSRTEAFREVINNSLFGKTIVGDVARNSLHTVFNATELRTGSAFRFGSKESGCWRFGTIPQKKALVADAVAASAAHPAFFPALERKYRITKKNTLKHTRVLLSDGGLFENLGVSPMEPGRSASISTNVFKPDYIICCDAGIGLFDDGVYPTRWPCRMYRSFLTTSRKLQDAMRKRLHRFAKHGEISGFVLCYLGQQDDSLPWVPGGLPRRKEVIDYPTKLGSMSTVDIDRLALRGELLMRFLVSYYLPKI